MFPSQWNAFCKKVQPGIRCPARRRSSTRFRHGAKSENGSNNVATYITASYGNGAIGYDEYAYALNAHYPVVKLLNPAGYYVLPTRVERRRRADQGGHQRGPVETRTSCSRTWTSVYTFTDPRSYPLSSYSYLIVPREGTSSADELHAGQGQDAEHVHQLLPLRAARRKSPRSATRRCR